MKGAYTVKIWNENIKYEFTINRQINIVKGNSGTGKTTLISMVDLLYRFGSTTGVHLDCPVDCVTIFGVDWQSEISKIDNSIIFLDENSRFIKSKDFAKVVEHSNNYYVIVSRDPLYNLPYSINCVFGIRESGRYGGLQQVYNELYNLYEGSIIHESGIKPELVITEDLKSGYQFFKEVGKRHNFKCRSADGKSNVDNEINTENKLLTLIVVDGAAFGSDMDSVIAKLKRLNNYMLYAPESFEWLILKSGVLGHIDKLEDKLEHTENYADSTKYFSWERFYTALIKDITKNMGKIQYSKSKLPDWYKREDIADQIVATINKVKL